MYGAKGAVSSGCREINVLIPDGKRDYFFKLNQVRYMILVASWRKATTFLPRGCSHRRKLHSAATLWVRLRWHMISTNCLVDKVPKRERLLN